MMKVTWRPPGLGNTAAELRGASEHQLHRVHGEQESEDVRPDADGKGVTHLFDAHGTAGEHAERRLGAPWMTEAISPIWGRGRLAKARSWRLRLPSESGRSRASGSTSRGTPIASVRAPLDRGRRGARFPQDLRPRTWPTGRAGSARRYRSLFCLRRRARERSRLRTPAAAEEQEQGMASRERKATAHQHVSGAPRYRRSSTTAMTVLSIVATASADMAVGSRNLERPARQSRCSV